MALTALIGPATKLLGKFIEDKDQKNKLAHQIATMAEKHAQELAKGQLDINKEQAKRSPPRNNVGLLLGATMAVFHRPDFKLVCYYVQS